MTSCPGAIVAGASYRALAVIRSLGRHGVPVWVLQTDERSVARLHPALSEYLVLTVPPWDVLEAAYDKRVMHAVAARAEIAQPATLFPGSAEQLSRVERFPVVVKPGSQGRAERAYGNEVLARRRPGDLGGGL